jgi:hypothetical protein
MKDAGPRLPLLELASLRQMSLSVGHNLRISIGDTSDRRVVSSVSSCIVLESRGNFLREGVTDGKKAKTQ